MRLAVPAETSSDEPRVAISPEAVKAYVKKGVDVVIEAGAGKGSFFSDDAFTRMQVLQLPRALPQRSRMPMLC